MHDRTVPFAHARFILLILCFTAAAAAAYFLQDRLPGTRIFCMPKETSLTGPAAEFALWLAASLTVCAVPLAAGLTLYRGACFGLTLALLTDPLPPLTTTASILPITGYALTTLVMLFYLCGIPAQEKRTLRHCLTRFLPCAGFAFAIVITTKLR